MIRLICCLSALLLLLSGCFGREPADSSMPVPPVSDAATSSPTNDDLLREYTIIEAENYDYYIQSDGIYRKENASGAVTRLVQTANAEVFSGKHPALQLEGEYLYYMTRDNASLRSLCRAPTSGGTPEVVVAASDISDIVSGQLFYYTIYRGKIYLCINLTLHCYDPATDTIQEVLSDVNSYSFYGDSLYYTDHANRTFTIYRRNLATAETAILLGDGTYEEDKLSAKDLYKYFVFDDDLMYYYKRADAGLYRYENGVSTLLSDDENINEFSLTVTHGKLYYIHQVRNIDPGPCCLTEFDPATRHIRQIAELPDYSPTQKIRIRSGYAYYANRNHQIFRVPLS